jgi:hypothetical protein
MASLTANSYLRTQTADQTFSPLKHFTKMPNEHGVAMRNEYCVQRKRAQVIVECGTV